MTELFHNWITGLITASALSACAAALCKKDGVGRVLRFGCALLMLTALLGPLRGLDWEEYGKALRENKALTEELTEKLRKQNESMERLYIEEECAAYILDEARKLGLEGKAEVRAKWCDSAFLPWEATLYFGDSPARGTLSALIEAELGIPAERQVWE